MSRRRLWIWAPTFLAWACSIAYFLTRELEFIGAQVLVIAFMIGRLVLDERRRRANWSAIARVGSAFAGANPGLALAALGGSVAGTARAVAAQQAAFFRTINAVHIAGTDLGPPQRAPAPLLGYRAWRLATIARQGHEGWERVHEPFALLSFTPLGDTEWPTDRPLRAQCRCLAARVHVPCPAHAAPEARCTCGIYAASSLDHVWRDLTMLDPSGAVIGLVAGWGRVIEHEAGWRAQFARVVALVDRGLAVEITKLYGVPFPVLGQRPGPRSLVVSALAAMYGVPVLSREQVPAFASEWGA